MAVFCITANRSRILKASLNRNENASSGSLNVANLGIFAANLNRKNPKNRSAKTSKKTSAAQASAKNKTAKL